MEMNFHRKLPIPKKVKESFPLTEEMKAVKAKRDESIRAVFDGSLDKFILIIGPCSADHKEPVLEYISRLKRNDIEEDINAVLNSFKRNMWTYISFTVTTNRCR